LGKNEINQRESSEVSNLSLTFFEVDMTSITSESMATFSEVALKTSTSDELLSVIIPCYNEEERIYKNLQECLYTFRLMGMPFEIIAVNDGSTDNTFQEMTRLAIANHELVPVTYGRNAGKGYALRVGAMRAMGNMIMFMDADLEIHPRQTPLFIREMRRTKADIVIGSKRHPQSLVIYPKKREVLSWGYHVLVKIVFDLELSDTQPGFKLLKRDVLEKELSQIRANRYAFDLELLVNAKADGYKIVEAPIELNFNRPEGGRIGFGSVNNIFKETLGIYFRYRKRARRKAQTSTVPSKDQDLPSP